MNTSEQTAPSQEACNRYAEWMFKTHRALRGNTAATMSLVAVQKNAESFAQAVLRSVPAMQKAGVRRSIQELMTGFAHIDRVTAQEIRALPERSGAIEGQRAALEKQHSRGRDVSANTVLLDINETIIRENEATVLALEEKANELGVTLEQLPDSEVAAIFLDTEVQRDVEYNRRFFALVAQNYGVSFEPGQIGEHVDPLAKELVAYCNEFRNSVRASSETTQ